jgi:hypothetical protein
MTGIARFVQQGINDLGQLKDALQLAMQLEFATLPPYLCAQWSIENIGDPVNQTIGDIAIQEMYHFALAGNMLTAIGGIPSVAHANFIPKYPTTVLPGGIAQKLPVDLKPLSDDQLKVFLQIEQPEFPPVALALAERPATIGAFYDTIIDGFKSTKPTVIQGANHVKMGEAFPIASISDAIKAINLIKGEGEGTAGSPDEPPSSLNNKGFAHYYRFKEILTGHALVNHSGKWSFTGAPIHFPAVFHFEPAVPGSHASDPFNKTLSDLLSNLQACWKSKGVTPDLGKMDMLQSEGIALIKKGIRPEFRWSN